MLYGNDAVEGLRKVGGGAWGGVQGVLVFQPNKPSFGVADGLTVIAWLQEVPGSYVR